MLECVKAMAAFFEANFYDIFVCVVIMVSAIIAVIGILKPVLFNKIKSKEIRKVALAFSNIALCFASALVYFLVEEWNFKYYLASAIALSVSCIITYWLYENTCLRNLIATIGNIVLRKVANVALISMSAEDVNQIKTEAKKASTEIKAQTKKALTKAAKEIKEDKDLKGL